MNRPEINVTPLIDVLLVLLIIFMVVTPIKPSAFKARIPAEPAKDPAGIPHPDTLVVAIDRDSTLRLNAETGLGNVDDASRTAEKLKYIFAQRIANYGLSSSADGSVPRAVFIKARRDTSYGSIAKVIDAVKIAGADPIALQIDDLD